MTMLAVEQPSQPLSLLRRKLSDALDDAIDLTAEQDWVWGERDCALWAANVIRAPLGYDPARAFRGRYRTARGYLRVLRRDGYESLRDALHAVAIERGWRGIDPKDANKGDLGFVAIESSASRGCCVLNYTATHWVGFRHYGQVYLPSDKITSAWKLA